jgi:hypothetical protein
LPLSYLHNIQCQISGRRTCISPNHDPAAEHHLSWHCVPFNARFANR